MAVDRNTLITVPHISNEGVVAILGSTLYQPYTSLFLSLTSQYQIDPLWCLAYMYWENGFGTVQGQTHFSWYDNNPWDIICRDDANWTIPCANYSSAGRWMADGCVSNGTADQQYCYAHYPTREIGLEAGIRRWSEYVSQFGANTYYHALSISLCGKAECNKPWPDLVIAKASQWSDQYPYTGPQPCNGNPLCADGSCPPCSVEPDGLSNIIPTLVGAGMLFAGVYLGRRNGLFG